MQRLFFKMRNKKKRNPPPQQPKDISSILQLFFAQNPDKEFSEKNILRKFSNYGSRNELLRALFVMVKKSIITHNDGMFSFAGTLEVKGEPIEGVIEITQNGAGYLLTGDDHKDIYIPPRFTNRALDGDRVSVLKTSRSGKRPEGIVSSIVQRAKTQFVGNIHKNGKHVFVVPDSRKIHVDFYIEKYDKNIAHNDKVIVEMIRWTKDDKNPIARIVEYLGSRGNNDTEMKSILLDKGFYTRFSEAAQQAADALSQAIDAEEIARRRDCRNILTFTIDPTDAKDFDDAISFRPLDKNLFEVGVHIADVSHYVQPGSILDKEAYKRATSVYLVDRVAPMFPEILSNIICSLRPHEEKLCFAVIFTIDLKGNVHEVWYGRTVIYSDRRFTYDDAQQYLEGNKEEEDEYDFPLNTLDKIAEALRKKRFSEGAINFESPEVKFTLDKEGKPIGAYVKERKAAHMLIEDFMLLANKYVALFVGKEKNPTGKNVCIYRIHDEPDMERLIDFAHFAREFGHRMLLDTPRHIAMSLNRLMKDIEGKPEAHVLQQLGIRCMSKAAYSTHNIGHYGLGFEYYSHFTSPIRRYPDVILHRLLQMTLDKHPDTNGDLYEMQCKHCSERERAAMEAERESVKYKMTEFMAEKIGEHYEGIISGVKQWGIYVEIPDINCEGLIRQERLKDDSYVYEEKKHSFRGLFTDKIYRLGDRVRIKVQAVDMEKKQIDFEMA